MFALFGCGYPVAVEAVGYAVWEAHDRDRLARDVSRVENVEVAGVASGVVDQGHDVAVVLCRGRGTWDEDGLAGSATGREGSLVDRAPVEIVPADCAELHQMAVLLPTGPRRLVAVAMAAADQALVDTRELSGHVVQRRAPHAAILEVDRPAHGACAPAVVVPGRARAARR